MLDTWEANPGLWGESPMCDPSSHPEHHPTQAIITLYTTVLDRLNASGSDARGEATASN